jgi:hypothetical protein
MKIAIALSSALLLTGCLDETNKTQQSKAAAAAAASIQFTDNAEIDNIKRRIELTAKPGLLGFIVLLNEAGQPIMYEGVVGKITSGGKRLTPPDRSYGDKIRAAASDEGTWGSSAAYIFYWNTTGEYRQWSGQYLYSDKPLRLRVEPLVVSVK